MDGIINVYKEAGFTSHDVVAKLRGILHMKKIGHTGTLDPDATGVLPVALGKGTKLVDLLTDKEKTYEAVLHLGITTDTQDMSGAVLKEREVSVTEEEVKEVRERISQTEKQIMKIEEEGNVIDTVSGGNGGIQHFKIEGFPYPEYSRKKSLLYARKATLANLELELLETLNQVEEFIASVDDSRMRRIITLRFIDNLSWNKVANHIGGGNTEDSVKKSFYRFMEK